MPLVESSSQTSISANVNRMISEGKPLKQAQAIALEIARRAKSDGTMSQKDEYEKAILQNKMDYCGVTEEMILDEIERLETPLNVECKSRFI